MIKFRARRIVKHAQVATLGLASILVGCGGGSGGADASDGGGRDAPAVVDAGDDASLDLVWQLDGSTELPPGQDAADAPPAGDAAAPPPMADGPEIDAPSDAPPADGPKDSGTDASGDTPPADGSHLDGPMDVPHDAPVTTDGADADAGNPSDGGSMSDALADCTWTGDFDGDGMADCAVLRQTSGARGDILFRKGLGGGQLSATPVVSAGIVPVSRAIRSTVGVLDLNHDTRDDIIVESHEFPTPDPGSVTSFVQVFRGKADGTFVASPSADAFRLGGNQTYFDASMLARTFWGDFDGDGFVDVLGKDLPNSEWIILRSTAGDALEVLESLTMIGRGPVTIAKVAKMDPGPTDDIVALVMRTGATGCQAGNASGGGVYIYHGASTGFGGFPIPGTEFASGVSLEELDQDGIPDLIVRYPAGAMVCVPGCRQNNTRIFLSSANWTTTPTATAVLGFSDTPDLNGDGIGDDYKYCDGSPVRLQFNCGASSCPPTVVTLPGTEAALDLHLVDVNHDGKLDVQLAFVDGQKIFYQTPGGVFSLTPPP